MKDLLGSGQEVFHVRNTWESRCQSLADALLEACAAALPDADLRIDDRTKGMLAEEADPAVVPFYPIGNIYRFRLQMRSVRRLFGWERLSWSRWPAIVEFGMEEMWDAPRWTAEQGIRCYVMDARVAKAVLPIVERFARDHGILFRAAWSEKDP